MFGVLPELPSAMANSMIVCGMRGVCETAVSEKDACTLADTGVDGGVNVKLAGFGCGETSRLEVKV
jgi:hypothetical protein